MSSYPCTIFGEARFSSTIPAILMTWARKTFWVRKVQDGTLEYAFVSDSSLENLKGILDLDPTVHRLESVTKSHPCSTCSVQDICMETVWNSGQRMSGPSPGQAPLSDVVLCRFCVSPALTMFKRGLQNLVPLGCPRRNTKVGECDACRAVRATLVEKGSPTNEARGKAQIIIGTILRDPDISEIWEDIPQTEQDANLIHWTLLLSSSLWKDPSQLTRAMVLEMTDGPLEKAWMAKSAASRKFNIRCWEGIIKQNRIL